MAGSKPGDATNGKSIVETDSPIISAAVTPNQLRELVIAEARAAVAQIMLVRIAALAVDEDFQDLVHFFADLAGVPPGRMFEKLHSVMCDIRGAAEDAAEPFIHSDKYQSDAEA